MEQGSRHSYNGSHPSEIGPPPPSETGSSSVGNGVPQSFLHGVPQAFGKWEPLARRRGTRSSVMGYTSLREGLYSPPSEKGSPPSQSGSRPRVGVPGPGKRVPSLGKGDLVPRQRGTRPSGKACPSLEEWVYNPQSGPGYPSLRKAVRIQGNTGARHSET